MKEGSMVRVSEKIITHIRNLISQVSGSEIAIELWDGTVLYGDLPEKLRIRIKSADGLKRLLYFQTPVSLGEAYINGDLDLIGDYEKAFELADRLFGQKQNLGRWLKTKLIQLLQPIKHSHERRFDFKGHPERRDWAKQAISFHYDLPVDFWQQWLDKSLGYTCAYFKAPTKDLAEAQLNKYEYVCRKLYLKKGERLLDLGCGWGGLAMYAAKNFGAEVVGVTLSSEQAKYAADQIKRLGLDRSCSVVNMDLRDFQDGRFDKVASFGVVEHFGKKRALPEFFGAAWNNLKAGGLFLCQGITAPKIETGKNKGSFTDRYLFPGFQVSSVSHLLRHAEDVGFEIRDVEALREHYVRTFGLWRDRLEKSREEIVKNSGETVYRIFLLSLWYLRHNQFTGQNGLHQILLSKPAKGNAGIPMTRDSWYR
jgi:cyclopropane-fatty-acyl-phospholipid synthase